MAQSIGPRLYSCCNCRNHVGLPMISSLRLFREEPGEPSSSPTP
ncbi:unnamed protein product [Brassica rapa subsp. narinosa]